MKGGNSIADPDRKDCTTRTRSPILPSNNILVIMNSEEERVVSTLATDEALIQFIKKAVISRMTAKSIQDKQWLESVVKLTVAESIAKLEIDKMVISAVMDEIASSSEMNVNNRETNVANRSCDDVDEISVDDESSPILEVVSNKSDDDNFLPKASQSPVAVVVSTGEEDADSSASTVPYTREEIIHDSTPPLSSKLSSHSMDDSNISTSSASKHVHFKPDVVSSVVEIRDKFDTEEKQELFCSYMDTIRAQYFYQRQREIAEADGFASWNDWIAQKSETGEIEAVERNIARDFEESVGGYFGDDARDDPYAEYVDDDDMEEADEEIGYRYDSDGEAMFYMEEERGPVFPGMARHPPPSADDDYDEEEEIHSATDDDWGHEDDGF